MIEITNLFFSYPNRDPLFINRRFEFPDGAVSAIVGASGTGKSTLLYIAGLLLRPNAGRVSISGCDTYRMSDRQRSGLRGTKLGFVFQDAALDPRRSIIDNVLEGSAFRGGATVPEQLRAQRLLDDLGVSLPLAAKPTEISGGQAQRIAICRALVGRPSVILADEPTGNLDPANTEFVIARLAKEARAGACVVIASHDPKVIGTSDLVVNVNGALA